MPHQSGTARPPAPGTATAVHLLLGRPPGRMPVVEAALREVAGEPLMYLRFEVDDRERQHARHKVDVTFSGPPADIHALLAQVTAAVEQAELSPEEG
jgi:hypothetical protein